MAEDQDIHSFAALDSHICLRLIGMHGAIGELIADVDWPMNQLAFEMFRTLHLRPPLKLLHECTTLTFDDSNHVKNVFADLVEPGIEPPTVTLTVVCMEEKSSMFHFLREAIREGDLSTAQRCLELDSQAFYDPVLEQPERFTKGTGCAMLANAVNSGDTSVCRLLIEARAPVGIVDLKEEGKGRGKGMTSKSGLSLAVERGHVKICQVLLDGGACANIGYRSIFASAGTIMGHTPNCDRSTSPLSLAVKSGHVEICQMLLDGGALANSASKSSEYSDRPLCSSSFVSPALYDAALAGRADICRLLVNHRADPNCKRVTSGHNDSSTIAPYTAEYKGSESCLSLTAEHGHVEICEVLLDGGAYANSTSTYKDKGGGKGKMGKGTLFTLYRMVVPNSTSSEHALYHAVQNGRADICRLLLHHRADPSFATAAGECRTLCDVRDAPEGRPVCCSPEWHGWHCRFCGTQR